MPISITGKTEKGLTLVELLVVLLIIGMTAGLVVLSAPRGGSDLGRAAAMVEREIAGLRDQAVSRVALYGLNAAPQRLDRFEATDGQWTLSEQTAMPGGVTLMLRAREGWSLPEHEEEVLLAGELSERREDEAEAFQPMVIFSAEGSVTPFIVELRDGRDQVIIRVDPFGQLEVGDAP